MMIKGIRTIINRDIRPLIRQHDGDIEFVSYQQEAGVVTVQLTGACVGCPLSRITLKIGVLQTLQKTYPEILDIALA